MTRIGTGGALPTVSVVVPTRNRSALVARAIASALAQTHPPLEVIVVDDASSDETAAVVAAAARADRRIRYVRVESSRGASHARNRGLAMAVGEYVALLDDDDEWMAEKTRVQLAALRRTGAAIATCWFVESYAHTEKVLFRTPGPVSFRALLRENLCGGFSCVLASRSVFDALGALDEDLGSGQDWDFWLRAAAAGYGIAVVPEPLVMYRHAGMRISSDARAKLSGHRRLFDKYERHFSSADRRHWLKIIAFYELMGAATLRRKLPLLARICRAVDWTRYCGGADVKLIANAIASMALPPGMRDRVWRAGRRAIRARDMVPGALSPTGARSDTA